jgi:hypothetical protein
MKNYFGLAVLHRSEKYQIILSGVSFAEANASTFHPERNEMRGIS